MSEKELAEEIQAKTKELQIAINKALEEGLSVVVLVDTIQTIGKLLDKPLIGVKIYREL